MPSNVQYFTLNSHTRLTRNHQYSNIFKINAREDEKDWSGGIYFYISDTIRSDYDDKDHRYSILVETLRTIDCLKYIPELNVSDCPEWLYNQFLPVVSEIRGASFIERGNTPFFRWLAKNNFAFIDDLFDGSKCIGSEIILPYNYISTDYITPILTVENKQPNHRLF